MSADDAIVSRFVSWDDYSQFARRVRLSRDYVLRERDERFLRTVRATIPDRDVTLKEGLTLYRAQIGVDVLDRTDEEGNWIGEDTWAYGEDRMKPVAKHAREGRANRAGVPVLYVASTIETAVSEVRPWIDAELSVGWCRLLRPLRTLDLTRGFGRSSLDGPVLRHVLGGPVPTAGEVAEAVWTDIDNAFSQPVTRADDKADYAPTQILAELFRGEGYDAIGYKSHFGDTDKRGGYNIAIFDTGAVEVVSCAPYKVKSIKVVAEQSEQAWTKTRPNG